MRIGIIGRTLNLLKTAQLLYENGHEIGFIYTCRSEEHYQAKEKDFENFATKIGCPFYNDLKIVSNKASLSSHEVELCVSINWLTVLPDEILNAFPHGVLNAHAGDLPRYRGNACPNWAILNGEDKIGVCVHKMTKDLDAGPVLNREYFELSENTYIADVYEWLNDRLPYMFLNAVSGLESDSQQFEAQDPKIRPLYCFPRKPQDSRIDWTDSSEDILRLIRASSHPFAGAYSFLETQDLKVVIFRAKAYHPNFDFLAVPGQLCMSGKTNPIIACSDGLIELEDISIENESHIGSSNRLMKSYRNRLR